MGDKSRAEKQSSKDEQSLKVMSLRNMKKSSKDLTQSSNMHLVFHSIHLNLGLFAQIVNNMFKGGQGTATAAVCVCSYLHLIKIDRIMNSQRCAKDSQPPQSFGLSFSKGQNCGVRCISNS